MITEPPGEVLAEEESWVRVEGDYWSYRSFGTMDFHLAVEFWCSVVHDLEGLMGHGDDVRRLFNEFIELFGVRMDTKPEVFGAGLVEEAIHACGVILS